MVLFIEPKVLMFVGREREREREKKGREKRRCQIFSAKCDKSLVLAEYLVLIQKIMPCAATIPPHISL